MSGWAWPRVIAATAVMVALAASCSAPDGEPAPPRAGEETSLKYAPATTIVRDGETGCEYIVNRYYGGGITPRMEPAGNGVRHRCVKSER
jgi:hypothetical protein